MLTQITMGHVEQKTNVVGRVLAQAHIIDWMYNDDGFRSKWPWRAVRYRDMFPPSETLTLCLRDRHLSRYAIRSTTPLIIAFGNKHPI